MLLIVEKDTRGGICNKYMRDYDKSKKAQLLNYWDVNDSP